jgi:adenine-specific DNA-methyltransferase
LYFADNFAGPDDGRESRPRYDIFHPVTKKPCKKPSTGWRWDEARTKQALSMEPPLIHFGPDETTIPCRKSYLSEIDTEPFGSVFYRDGRAGTLELEKLVDSGLVEFPKDVPTLQEFITLVTDTDSIILDFLVQLPEPTDRKDFPTIADITKERVRRVIQKLNDEDAGKLPMDGVGEQDRGFRVFKLAESNFQTWDADAPKDAASLAQQLTLHVDHIRTGRRNDDILYELLLKSGFPLTTRVETLSLAGKRVYSVADGALLICLERGLTLELMRALAAQNPQRVVCLDEGFAGNDQLKVNAVQIFKGAGVESFKTV